MLKSKIHFWSQHLKSRNDRRQKGRQEAKNHGRLHVVRRIQTWKLLKTSVINFFGSNISQYHWLQSWLSFLSELYLRSGGLLINACERYTYIHTIYIKRTWGIEKKDRQKAFIQSRRKWLLVRDKTCFLGIHLLPQMKTLANTRS